MQLKKIQLIYVFISAFLFGTGLVISGMCNPEKIILFLSMGTPEWDPSLLIVLGTSVLLYAIAHQFMLKRRTTLFNTLYSPPSHHTITPRLLMGSVIFGIGWAFTGNCPGPAIMRLATLNPQSLIFVVAMFAGFALARDNGQ